ncbi:MAG: hypothetical protein NT004_13570 [Bacteroidetes bacterium]|nr:hypothetical protein [Bacteroidota bacterium]
MTNVADKLRISIKKRQDALIRYKNLKDAFLLSKEAIIKDIEEARSVWQKTLTQLPKSDFEQ